ncbi:MAG: hypothetical protein GF329_11705 [Candidatus Lokiarchaeota archaeon]|nr:hypothetical protein [Candidatus Lokiarchaeota archaeon]
MFAKEGLWFIIPSVIFNVIIIMFFNYFFNTVFGGPPIFGWFFSPLFVITAFFIFFFRDPKRTPEGAGILAPTDGTITHIEQKDGKTTLFIELAASDVHTQKAPFNGEVLDVEKIKGAHHPIYFVNKGKESEYKIPLKKNERINIEMVDEDGMKVKIVQIAGAVARRCRAYIKPGDDIQRGQKIGMIMFGSLLKFELHGNLEVMKSVGTHVKGGKHVILKKIA